MSFLNRIDVIPIMGFGFGFEIFTDVKWLFIDFMFWRLIIDYDTEDFNGK